MALSARALAQPPAERVLPLKVLDDSEGKLLVHEVYTSLQGEGTRTGLLCTFVRLTGCHLRCRYCDTEHAFDEGQLRSVQEVLDDVKEAGAPLVQVTGGEPLLQPATHDLMKRLCDEGFEVVLETSGAVSTAKVDPRVVVVLDVKTPGSGEKERNLLKNLVLLRPHDEVKLVLTGEEDYRFACAFIEEHALAERCAAILFSPVDGGRGEGGLSATELAEWMIRDRVKARLQLQQHKVLWGDRRGV